MDLARLVEELRPLLAAPADNSDAILELLSRQRRLADFEVARFLVAKRTESLVQSLLASPDPLQRRSGVRWVELTWARSPAARVLRDASKDRSQLVRRAAFRATTSLRIDDVALPDRSKTRAPVPARAAINPFTKERIVIPGYPAGPPKARRGYDPTGWRFGLYQDYSTQGRPTPSFTALQSRKDVETFLGLAADELTRLLRPGAGRGCAYVSFQVPKRAGGSRELHAPRAALKRAQRTILKSLLAPLEVHPAAHGFVSGRSTVSNAQPHVGARVVVKLDLVDFFPSIHFGRLVGLFRYYGMGSEASKVVAAIVSYRAKLADGRVAWPSVLPQGAPTSPALSNLVCRRLDARLTALAAKIGAVYTRYADDLTFSFREDPGQRLGHLLWWINQVIGQEGFVENLPKRRVLRPSGRVSVTGIITNHGLSISRDARRRFRALLHNCERHGITPESTGHPEPKAYLLGFAAYVAMVQPAAGARLRAEVKRLLAKQA